MQWCSWPVSGFAASPGAGLLEPVQARLDLPDGNGLRGLSAAGPDEGVIRITAPDRLRVGDLEKGLEGPVQQLAGRLGSGRLSHGKAVLIQPFQKLLRGLDVQQPAFAHCRCLLDPLYQRPLKFRRPGPTISPSMLVS